MQAPGPQRSRERLGTTTLLSAGYRGQPHLPLPVPRALILLCFLKDRAAERAPGADPSGFSPRAAQVAARSPAGPGPDPSCVGLPEKPGPGGAEAALPGPALPGPAALPGAPWSLPGSPPSAAAQLRPVGAAGAGLSSPPRLDTHHHEESARGGRASRMRTKGR